MDTKGGKRYFPPAVEQAGRILFILAQNNSAQMSLTQISKQAGISNSKAYGILNALEKVRLVKRGNAKKGYALGPGLIALSRKVLDDMDLYGIAKPVLDNLTRETGCSSVFGLITGDTVEIVAKKEGQGDIRIVMRVGLMMPLTHGAHGKAIVPFLTESHQKQILKRKDLHFHGTPEKLDRDKLSLEFAGVLESGFASARAQYAPGITVVCAPVLGVDHLPMGFVEIFVPRDREAARQLGNIVVRSAGELSANLGKE